LLRVHLLQLVQLPNPQGLNSVDALVRRKCQSPTHPAPRVRGGRPIPCSSCTPTTRQDFELTLLLFSSFPSPSSHPYFSSTFLPRSSAPLQNRENRGASHELRPGSRELCHHAIGICKREPSRVPLTCTLSRYDTALSIIIFPIKRARPVFSLSKIYMRSILDSEAIFLGCVARRFCQQIAFKPPNTRVLSFYKENIKNKRGPMYAPPPTA